MIVKDNRMAGITQKVQLDNPAIKAVYWVSLNCNIASATYVTKNIADTLAGVAISYLSDGATGFITETDEQLDQLMLDYEDGRYLHKLLDHWRAQHEFIHAYTNGYVAAKVAPEEMRKVFAERLKYKRMIADEFNVTPHARQRPVVAFGIFNDDGSESITINDRD